MLELERHNELSTEVADTRTDVLDTAAVELARLLGCSLRMKSSRVAMLMLCVAQQIVASKESNSVMLEIPRPLVREIRWDCVDTDCILHLMVVSDVQCVFSHEVIPALTAIEMSRLVNPFRCT